MNTLLTGAGGFIGSVLNTGLSSGNCYTTHHSSSFALDGKKIHLDLANQKHVSQLIKFLTDKQIDAVVHTAGVTPYSHTDFGSDLEMARSISSIMRKLEIQKLFYTSGWIVYSPVNSLPFTEQSAIGPTSEYGRSKVRVEDYFKGISEIMFINLRLASVYGPGQITPGLIPNCVNSAFTDHKIVLHSLETRRDYLFSEDLLNIFLKLLHKPFKKSVDLNIGSDRSHSTLEIAQTVQQIFKKLFAVDIYLDTHHSLHEIDQYPDNQLSVKELKKTIPDLPHTPLSIGLEKYISWVKQSSYA